MKPVIKYPGGKEKELQFILPNSPQNIKNYYEPFLGGGAVFFSMPHPAFVNDKSEELIRLYRSIAEQEPTFFGLLDNINYIWTAVSDYADYHSTEWVNCYQQSGDFLSGNGYLEHLITKYLTIDGKSPDAVLKSTLSDKLARSKKIEGQQGFLSEADIVSNMECAVKRGIYTHLRDVYNVPEGLSDGQKSALFFFQREYCYSSMFRYNASGKFNVPYGGISYNRKSMTPKIAYMHSTELVKKLREATIECMDFYEFMTKHEPEPKDFVFLDPPYDTDFSDYAGSAFGQDDQRRLADYLINECCAQWQLVIKATDFIRSLYPVGQRTVNGGKIVVQGFDKRYMVSFMDRNIKECEHLLITNYEAQNE